MCTVNQKAFETAIRVNLSPEGVAAVIAFLQVASNYDGGDNEAKRKALREVAWMRDTLLEMLGVDEFNRLMNEIGL